VRKAFPKPRLLWYVDRASLTEQPGGNATSQQDNGTDVEVVPKKNDGCLTAPTVGSL